MSSGNPIVSSASDTLISYINLKLALMGYQPASMAGGEFGELAASLVAQYREKERLLATHVCAADQRIQTFLYDYLQDVPVSKLPARTLTLDRAGMARVLSLPVSQRRISL